MHRPDDVSPAAKAFATAIMLLFGGLVVVSSLAGSRLATVPASGMADFLSGYQWLTTVACWLWLLRERPPLAFVVTALLAATLAHAYCHLATPQLAAGSEESILNAELYVGHAAMAALSGLAAGLAFATASPRARQALLYLVVGAFAANTLATYLQGGHPALLEAWTTVPQASGRVRGLLEDAQALTTYGATLVTGLFYLMLFGTWQWYQRLLWFMVSVLVGWTYLATGSRAYLAIVTMGLIFALPLALIHVTHAAGRERAKWLVPAVALASVLLILCVPFTPLIKLDQDLTRTIGGLGASDGLLSIVAKIGREVLQLNDARVASLLALLADFAAHPLLGVGLGSVALDAADPLYLVLVAALGAAGVTLTLLLLTKAVSACRQLITVPTGLHGFALSRQAWLAFATGSYLSLLLSFLIGTQLSYLSLSALAGLAVFGLAMQPGMLLASTNLTHTLLLASLALLICGCLYMIWLF